MGSIDSLWGLRREESEGLPRPNQFMLALIIHILNTGKEASLGDGKRREVDWNLNVSFYVSHSRWKRTGWWVVFFCIFNSYLYFKNILELRGVLFYILLKTETLQIIMVSLSSWLNIFCKHKNRLSIHLFQNKRRMFSVVCAIVYS